MDSMRAVQYNPTHVAQFNDDGAPRITEIGRVLSVALHQGVAVVCIATGTHRRLLERQLIAHGIDILAVLSREQYVSLNALETLSKIVIEGVPDAVRFAEVVGVLVDRSAARYPRVLIFGELVALMCADGQNAAAAELENLWRPFMAARPLFRRQELDPPVEYEVGLTSGRVA